MPYKAGISGVHFDLFFFTASSSRVFSFGRPASNPSSVEVRPFEMLELFYPIFSTASSLSSRPFC